MGRYASRFVELSDDDRVWLEQQWKHAMRSRSHAVLLSSQRYCMAQISQILSVSYETVEAWLDRWNEQGLVAWPIANGSAALPSSALKTQNILREIVEQHPQEPSVICSSCMNERISLSVVQLLGERSEHLVTAGSVSADLCENAVI